MTIQDMAAETPTLVFGKTIKAAHESVFGRFRRFAKLAAIPFALMLLARALKVPVGQYLPEAEIALFIVDLLPFAILGVAQSRAVLLGEAAGFLPPQPLGRHPQFPNLAYWLAFTFIGCVKLRFAFIFAALAVDERYGLGFAWRHSHSASLPLFILFVVAIVFPVAALTFGINALSLAFADNVLLLYALWLMWHAGTWVIEATYTTFIAIAFRRCTGWVPAPDQSVLERFE